MTTYTHNTYHTHHTHHITHITHITHTFTHITHLYTYLDFSFTSNQTLHLQLVGLSLLDKGCSSQHPLFLSAYGVSSAIFSITVNTFLYSLSLSLSFNFHFIYLIFVAVINMNKIQYCHRFILMRLLLQFF